MSAQLLAVVDNKRRPGISSKLPRMVGNHAVQIYKKHNPAIPNLAKCKDQFLASGVLGPHGELVTNVVVSKSVPEISRLCQSTAVLHVSSKHLKKQRNARDIVIVSGSHVNGQTGHQRGTAQSLVVLDSRNTGAL